MGYVLLALVAVALAFGVKLWNKYEHAAQEAGIAKAEKQIAQTALDVERDSKRETAAIIAKRPIRAKAVAIKKVARKAADVQQRTIDPVYLRWADELVPVYVADRLRANADADEAVHRSAADSKPRSAVQAESTNAAGSDDKRGFSRLRSFVTGRD